MNLVNTAYDSTEDLINKLQSLKGKTKLKFYKHVSNYYNERKNKNFETNHEDPFSRNAQGSSKIYHEVLLLMKFLHTDSEVKNMNIKYYDLYYTVIKSRDDKDFIDNENDYIKSIDFVTPYHYIRIKHRETKLK